MFASFVLELQHCILREPAIYGWITYVNRWVVEHLQIAIQNEKWKITSTLDFSWLFPCRLLLHHRLLRTLCPAVSLISALIYLHLLYIFVFYLVFLFRFFSFAILCYSMTRNYYRINEKCQPSVGHCRHKIFLGPNFGPTSFSSIRCTHSWMHFPCPLANFDLFPFLTILAVLS